MLQEGEAPAEIIPVNLFRVSKAISAEAIRVFYNETCFCMGVTPFRIRNREAVTRRLDSFTNHAVLAEWRPFKCMRNYHLNIKSSPVAEWFDPIGMYIFKGPPTYEDGTPRIKEWLRLIADELVNHGLIQNLTITAPCNCAQKAAGRVPGNMSTVVDLFAPLKRICVPGFVSISFHHDKEETWRPEPLPQAKLSDPGIESAGEHRPARKRTSQ
ncbi:MAG: hypothetical protein Q9173_004786 [Seirophora scorigena]